MNLVVRVKLLFDQNLSRKLSDRLQGLFPGSLHMHDVLVRRTPDESIWFYARHNDFVVVTKDADFRELSERLGHPPKVILIRTGNSPNEVVEALLRDHYGEILAFEQDPARGIIELG